MGKTNCYMCGRSVDREDTVQKQFNGGIRTLCEDRDDCRSWVADDEFSFAPEDSPCLEPPWWRYQ